jgi:3',5'-cyclic AMP phosphodiesterase CpdA
VLVAQITDCHIVERGELLADRFDTAAMLRAAVAHVVTMNPRPDVLLATGDLVHDGRSAQYEQLGEILADLTMPVYPIPGNHDDRGGLRALFPDMVPAGSAEDCIDYVVDEHPIRLVGLDTTIPGEGGGRLEREQLVWLDDQLAREPDRPTLIFQHHPPFVTGIDCMDRVGLENGPQETEVVARHPQVELLTSGHIHRAVHTRFGGTVASCWPSTGVQVALALDGTPHRYVDEPAGVALHRWDARDGVASHFSYVDAADPWLQPWAKQAT